MFRKAIKMLVLKRFLNQKGKKKNNILVMLNIKKIDFVPAIVLAFSTCFFFYFFLILNVSFLIIGFFLVALIITLFLIRHVLPKKLLIFLVIVVIGFSASCIAHIRLNILKMPFLSLAQTERIEKVTILLSEDVKPRGHKYYASKVEILKCKCKDCSTYSCKGRIIVLFPATIIKENYSGGISLNRGNEVSMFCKGLKIEVQGYFPKEKNLKDKPQKTFFVYEKAPIIFLGWKNKLLLYRTHLRFSINRLLYGWGKAGSLLLALLEANKDFISLKDSTSFRNAGLSHVLALSGMHLAIIGLLSTYFVSFFLSKKALKFFLIASSFIFLFFAGASPSLIRAFLMLSIISIARLLCVKVNLLGVLSFTFTIHLILFPEDSLTLSFMLSYSALFGILVCSKAISYFFNSFLPDVLNESLSASLGATFFTIPIVAISIKQVAIIGIISTCIISPLISIFLMLGIVFIFLSLLFPPSYRVVGYLLNLFYDCIIHIVYFFTKFPVLKIENYPLSFFPVIFAIFLIVFYKIRTERDLKKLKF